MAKTVDRVIVDHSHRLHESVADRGADEIESPFFEVFAHLIRDRGADRHFRDIFPVILDRGSIDIAPEKLGEGSKLFLNRQGALSVANGRVNLEAIADDPGIGEETLTVRVSILSDFFAVESIESLSIVFALFEDR